MWYVVQDDELYHHGIKGQRWGVRRFQNEDGTLTAAGKRRIRKEVRKETRKEVRRQQRKKLYKRKRRSGMADAAPAIIAVTAGTTIVAATMFAARYGSDIGNVIRQVQQKTVSSIEQSAVNTGKKAAEGIKNGAKYAFENAEPVWK